MLCSCRCCQWHRPRSLYWGCAECQWPSRSLWVSLASPGLLHLPPGSGLPSVWGMCQVTRRWPCHGRLTCSDPLVHLDPALVSLAEWMRACALTLCDTVKQRLHDKVKHLKTSSITVQWYLHQAPSQTKYMLGKQNHCFTAPYEQLSTCAWSASAHIPSKRPSVTIARGGNCASLTNFNPWILNQGETSKLLTHVFLHSGWLLTYHGLLEIPVLLPTLPLKPIASWWC